MIATHHRKLLVIIAEAQLERMLVADIRRLGAHGYTVSDVRGGGDRGERAADWEADRSIRIEVIAGDDVCEAIATHVLATWGPDYAVALYLSDVAVLRAETF